MSNIKTDGIVLRYANFGETDRMLTLLTPGGLVSVAAKGCRKATSRTLAASELFTAGEYMLYEKGERHTLSSFQLQENFYPIRMDMDKLSHGVYWLNLCEAVAQPGEDTSRLFKMMLLSLTVIAYGDLPTRALTAVFLSQFAMLQGFAPRLDRCIHCGMAARDGEASFDAVAGGIRCRACGGGGISLRQGVLPWMQEVQAKGAFILAGRRALPEGTTPEIVDAALAAYRAQVEHRIEKEIVSGKFL